MQDGRTNTETENNNQPDTTSKLVDTENIQQEKEELEYRNIDARVTEIIKNTYHKTDTKYMVEVPVPIFNWEIELKWYEKGIIFFKKTSDTANILYKLINFLIMVWIPLNYIKSFINERRNK